MRDFKMPSLGADMDEGTVLEWRVAPGDEVRKGDAILEIDTDKAAFEIEADRDGSLAEILVGPGEKVPVGTVLARWNADDAEAAAPAAAAPVEPARPTAAPPAAAAPPEPARRRASPRARALATELGVDLAAVTRGSGPGGSIVERDVEEAAAGAAPAGGAAAAPRPRREGLRRAIAATMSRSNREIPHYYLSHAIDLEAASTWLERVNADRPIAERILPNVLLLRAVVLALADVPELNGYWQDERLEPADAIHLGVAVSIKGGGVIAPAIRDARARTIDELMASLADLVERARAGRLKPAEMTDGTITVTSLGDRGCDAVHGVIFPPQVALVGFGAIARRPWVVGDAVVPRRAVTATLSADHRASDGHRGALFLRSLAARLEKPEDL